MESDDHDGARWDPQATPAFWINRASRALTRSFDARLRPVRVHDDGHLPVLGALARGGARSPTELADAARVEPSTMAETLARMVRDDIVTRAPDPDDGRASLVAISRRARSRLPGARAALVDGERAALVGFSAADERLLTSLLQRVVQNLEGEA